jgi:hypothetical protein
MTQVLAYLMLSGWCNSDQKEGEESFKDFLQIGSVSIFFDEL